MWPAFLAAGLSGRAGHLHLRGALVALCFWDSGGRGLGWGDVRAPCADCGLLGLGVPCPHWGLRRQELRIATPGCCEPTVLLDRAVQGGPWRRGQAGWPALGLPQRARAQVPYLPQQPRGRPVARLLPWGTVPLLTAPLNCGMCPAFLCQAVSAPLCPFIQRLLEEPTGSCCSYQPCFIGREAEGTERSGDSPKVTQLALTPGGRVTGTCWVVWCHLQLVVLCSSCGQPGSPGRDAPAAGQATRATSGLRHVAAAPAEGWSGQGALLPASPQPAHCPVASGGCTAHTAQGPEASQTLLSHGSESGCLFCGAPFGERAQGSSLVRWRLDWNLDNDQESHRKGRGKSLPGTGSAGAKPPQGHHLSGVLPRPEQGQGTRRAAWVSGGPAAPGGGLAYSQGRN